METEVKEGEIPVTETYAKPPMPEISMKQIPNNTATSNTTRCKLTSIEREAETKKRFGAN